MSGPEQRHADDDTIRLEPGEEILRRADASDRLVMRHFILGVGLIVTAALALLIMGDGVGWEAALTIIAVLAGAMYLYSHFFDRGARWILTNRRLIGPGSGSIPISPDLKIRVFIWGIAVRQSLLKTVKIRHIEDKSGFAAELRSAIMAKATGDIPQ